MNKISNILERKCKNCNEILVVGENWSAACIRQHRNICISCQKDAQHIYWVTNLEHVHAQQKIYREAHKDKVNRQSRAYRVIHSPANKKLVIARLGGKCVYCGEARIQFLTLGHKNNDGAEHRRVLFGDSKGGELDNYLVSHNFPEEDVAKIQVECWNCNEGKLRMWWVFPDETLNYHQIHNRQIARICFEHFGNKCECCGENNPKTFTVGHPMDDGWKQRKEIGRRGWGFYAYLIKNNFMTPYILRLECYNCNMGKRINGGVCPHETERTALLQVKA